MNRSLLVVFLLLVPFFRVAAEAAGAGGASPGSADRADSGGARPMEASFPAPSELLPPMATLYPNPLGFSLNEGRSGIASLSVSNTGDQALSYQLQFPPENRIFLDESFEGAVPPAGWSHVFTQTQVWRRTAGWDGYPPAAFHGAYNAGLFCSNNYTPAIDRLITPVLDLSQAEAVTLSFRHYQWEQSRPIYLKVFYRTANTEPWVQLASYASHTPVWTERVIPLPNPSATYQLAFEGSAYNGFGTHIDKVVVSSHLFDRPAWLSLGAVTSGTIAPGDPAQTLCLLFDGAGLEPGLYESHVSLVQNNPQNPVVTLPVSLSVVQYPEIALSAASLEFGLVPVGEGSNLVFSIANPGAATLEGRITAPSGFSVSLSDPEFPEPEEANVLDFSLLRGESRLFALRFEPVDMLDYSADLLLAHNAPEGESRIALEAIGGKAIPAVSVESIHIQKPLGMGGEYQFQLGNLGNLPLNYRISVAAEPQWLSLGETNEVSGTLRPGTEPLVVTLGYTQEGLGPGTHDAELLVETDAPDAPSLRIPAEFEIVNTPHSLELPESLSFHVGEELVLDLAPYIQDADQQSYWFTSEPSTNVMVGGYDTMLRLYSLGDWTGEETIHLTVLDHWGEAATDSVLVKVSIRPLRLTLSCAPAKIHLNWNAIPGASTYGIYRSDAPGGEYLGLGQTTELHWEDSDVLEKAFYRVKALE